MKGWAIAATVLLAPALAQAEGPLIDGTVGWGYYELLHVGAAVHLDERSTVGALVGSNLGLNGKTDWTAGLSYAHAVGQPLWDVQLGWKVETLYWTQTDPSYDWKLLSLVFGATAVRPLTPELSLALDVGAAWTYTLASDRKQNVDFSHPLKWNGSACLELWIHFGRW